MLAGIAYGLIGMAVEVILAVLIFCLIISAQRWLNRRRVERLSQPQPPDRIIIISGPRHDKLK